MVARNTKVSNSIKKDLISLSTNLRNLQLTIADATYALKHHVVVPQKDLKIVEQGLDELDKLRMQLISLSSVGSRTYQTLARDESLIQSLRLMKSKVSSDNQTVLSKSYVKSRNSVMLLLKNSLEEYLEEEFNDEDYESDTLSGSKSPTEQIKTLLLSFPLKLVNAYCQFFITLEEKVQVRTRKSSRKNSFDFDFDKDIEVMRSVYNLSEAYKDVFLKNFISVEELIGIIKGIHITQLQFEVPLIDTLSIASLSVIFGAALAIKQLEDKQ